MSNPTRIIGAVFAAVLASLTLLGAGPNCSIHPKKGATKAELTSMVKVSQDEAQKAALASLKDPSKAVMNALLGFRAEGREGRPQPFAVRSGFADRASVRSGVDLVGRVGLEPTTTGLKGRCSTD